MASSWCRAIMRLPAPAADLHCMRVRIGLSGHGRQGPRLAELHQVVHERRPLAVRGAARPSDGTAA